MKLAWAAALALLVAAPSHADDADDAALKLADQAPVAPESGKRRDWQFSLEPALLWARLRPEGVTQPAQRLSLDFSWGRELAPGWRLVAADRLDLYGPARAPGDREAVNTLKELYLSTRAGPEVIVDLGRVNARQGVASGYNPTDYFREQAVRSATSVNPASLRENRMGTVMLRGQRVWTGTSVSAIVAPKLADAPNDAPLGANLGATNQRTRWLLSWSQRLGDDFAPQWLLYGDGDADSGPQLGLNLTRLLSRACVGHLEASGGRSPTLQARARQQAHTDVRFHAQWASGFSCTNTHKLTLTLEFQRNGAALDKTGWQALRDGPLADYLAYRQLAQTRQDPVTRNNLFVHVLWPNAFMPRLDLSGFMRQNLADHSRLSWLEARYRLDSTDLALQWQTSAGSRLSEYGPMPQRHVWQLLLKHYF